MGFVLQPFVSRWVVPAVQETYVWVKTPSAAEGLVVVNRDSTDWMMNAVRT